MWPIAYIDIVRTAFLEKMSTHEVETKMKVTMATNYLYLYVLQWHRCQNIKKDMKEKVKMLKHKNLFVDM